MDNQPTRYTVTDGKMVLVLEVAEEGGFVVTAPDIKGLITEADTLEEAFEMARDAAALLGTGTPAGGKVKTRSKAKTPQRSKKHLVELDKPTGIVHIAGSKVKQGTPVQGRFSGPTKRLVKPKAKMVPTNDE